jgi:TatD family-associated radical SAM protein
MSFTITYTLGESLYINVTNRCTNRCSFCVRDNTSGIAPDLDLWLDREPTVEEIIESIRVRDLSTFKELVFCGYGEPLMRAYDIFDVCKAIKKISDISIRVNTNGQANLFFKNDITQDMEGLIDICSISLNASSADKYNNLCNSDYKLEAFEGIIQFAKSAKKYVPKVVFSVVDVMEKEEIEECRQIALDCGVDFRIREIIK